MAKQRSWQCRSCSWFHDASHKSCFWCDKKASSLPKPPPPPSGGGAPDTGRKANRWAKFLEWKTKKATLAASGALSGGALSESPMLVDPLPGSVPGALSLESAKALLALENSAVLPAELLAQAKAVVDAAIIPVEKPPAPPTARTLLDTENRLKKAVASVDAATAKVAEAESVLQAAKEALSGQVERVDVLKAKVQSIKEVLLGEAPAQGTEDCILLSRFEATIGAAVDELVGRVGETAVADPALVKARFLAMVKDLRSPPAGASGSLGDKTVQDHAGAAAHDALNGQHASASLGEPPKSAAPVFGKAAPDASTRQSPYAQPVQTSQNDASNNGDGAPLVVAEQRLG